MNILAIDPGDKRSAAVLFDPVDWQVWYTYFDDNERVLAWLVLYDRPSHLVIEGVASYGMPVGREVFDTCIWIGRFIQAWRLGEVQLLYRKDIKLHLCGSSRAKDSNVRAVLMDKFGGVGARGTKKAPGPLFGISGDKWSALAVAVTWAETRMMKGIL